MDFRLSELPKILYKPRESFENINKGVNLSHGVIFLVSMVLLSVLLSLSIIKLFNISSSQLPNPIVAGSMGLASSSIGIQIALAFFFLLSTTLAAGALTSWWAHKEFRLRSSLKLIGYSSFFDLVKFTVATLVFSRIVKSIIKIRGGKYGLLSTGAMQQIQGLWRVFGIFLILFFIWELWIRGTAIAVANDASTVKGIVSWFSAVIVTGTFTILLGLFLTIGI